MEKPDFYTESLRVYPNNVTDKYLWDGPHKAGINPKWQCSQDETETFARCRQEGCEHVWNTHVVPLQEKIAGFDSLLDTLNDQAKREFKKLESENKALQEKLKIAEHLKELADDAIVTLQREVERLKADLKNANSALDNISNMGHC